MEKKTKLRVLFTWHSLVVPGYRKYIEELAKYEDLDITLLVPTGWTEGGKYVKCHRSNVKSVQYKTIIAKTFNNNHLDTFVYYATPFILNKVKPDIIHLFEEPWTNCAAVFMFFRKMFVPNSKYIFHTFQNLNLEYSKSYDFVEKQSFKNSAGAFACSREIKEVLLARGYQKEIFVIPVGTDPGLFYPRDASGLRKKLGLAGTVFGYVGRLVPEKGIDTLVRAFAGLADGSSLLLIGNGPQKQELQALANKLGCEKKIVWLSALDQNELPLYMNAMDCLVLPSLTTPLWKEQFGRVLVEAMLSKVAVIGSSSGEIPHVIGDAGMVFPEGDYNALLQHMTALLSGQNVLARWREKAYKRAQEQFTWQKIAKRTREAYLALAK